MQWFHPVKGQIWSVSILLFFCTFIKTVEVAENLMYILFMIEVFFIGIAYNLGYILQDILIFDPQLKSTSLEFNFCIGQFSTLFVPLVAGMAEPIPTGIIWFFGIMCILTASQINLGPYK